VGSIKVLGLESRAERKDEMLHSPSKLFILQSKKSSQQTLRKLFAGSAPMHLNLLYMEESALGVHIT
jgi:hypothetical protein